MKAELGQALAVLDALDSNTAEVEAILAKVHAFGPLIRSALVPMLIGAADMKAAVFKRHLENGFSRDEALRLTISDAQQIAKAVQSARGNYPSLSG